MCYPNYCEFQQFQLMEFCISLLIILAGLLFIFSLLLLLSGNIMCHDNDMTYRFEYFGG